MEEINAKVGQWTHNGQIAAPNSPAVGSAQGTARTRVGLFRTYSGSARRLSSAIALTVDERDCIMQMTLVNTFKENSIPHSNEDDENWAVHRCRLIHRS